MADRKVIHLHIDGDDYYFGSVSAIYSVFSKEQLGIGYGSLRNYGLSPTKPYNNEKKGRRANGKFERGAKREPKEEMIKGEKKPLGFGTFLGNSQK